ncbi:hypothetical protein MMB17_05575 [Methylobacterium organophilum]|uniref:hypothetical protein n=1 Tax=Methylobacterium organophilum TaxID=410 RepID=UPI001F13BBD1|nr:hypothetical protein [Methylobacterium organophilum]UMY18786.1 hypothetical protein MMB17_05575 [Methylobacterium organophilum]
MTRRGSLRAAIERLPLRLQTVERDGDLVRDRIEPGRPVRVYRVRIFRSGLVYVPVSLPGARP